jgi:4-coumarate--CoA ligase (photoactive yellow protein activation family)
MALANSRRFFLGGFPLDLGQWPAQHRQLTAKSAIDFFQLDAKLQIRMEQTRSIERWADIVLEAVQTRSSFSLSFRTSGSTGTPSGKTFCAAALEEEAESLAAHFTNVRRVVSVVPVHHVYGFMFAVMLPRRLSIPAVHLHPMPTAEFFRTLETGDIILAFPLFWDAVLKMTNTGNEIPWKKNLCGLTSGSPCAPEIIRGLLGGPSPFLSRMTEIYGATEFGAVGIRHDCRGQYTLLPHWRRVLVAENLNGIAAQPDQEEWGICGTDGNPSSVPDILDWHDERHFTPVKRKDKAVQVSSINVFPAKIADLIRAHPKVSDCAVRLMRPTEGSRLKAFVVPAGRYDVVSVEAYRSLRCELRIWLSERLEPAAVPKSITFGEFLPLSPSGKAADWRISNNDMV